MLWSFDIRISFVIRYSSFVLFLYSGFGASMCSITWSISPYSIASSADMKRSRSVSFSIFSKGCPVCLMRMRLSRSLTLPNSLA